ncbi:complement C1q subcomponent subunit A-like [Odontesthes bonariensis]|uniref:complement C1q subcomponent subunit A-like n=1 Tax=Odontesthes bonariensis TaxID=219752 RepID=UPI003F5841A0
MALQWLTCSTAVLLLLVHVILVDTQCSGIPGIPGIPGTHGPNGKDGLRGAKGDAGVAGEPIRGQKGVSGMRGPPGRAGLKGDVGLQGHPGYIGQRGEKGRPFNPSNENKPFFSYKYVMQQMPELDTAMNFNGEFLPGVVHPGQEATMESGEFICKTKGIYFFSYHVSARSKVCLKLVKNSETHMMLCDISEGFLVSSGSAILELQNNDRVSLQPTEFSSIVMSQGSTSHTLTGFLIFPTP